MKALLVYDSFFGNTERIAQAVGNALRAKSEIGVLRVGDVKSMDLANLDLLIVGSPTRGFRPTEGIAKFLNSVTTNQLRGVEVAAFDTRIALETINSSVFRFIVDKGGYAASTIAKTLEKKGAKLRVPPEGFIVTGEQGPLKEGELERAAQWANAYLTKESLIVKKTN